MAPAVPPPLPRGRCLQIVYGNMGKYVVLFCCTAVTLRLAVLGEGFDDDEGAFCLPRQYLLMVKKSLINQGLSGLRVVLLHHYYTIWNLGVTNIF